MKNYEKYADKIKNYGYDSFCDDFIQPYILKQNGCGMDCEQCNMIQMIWLMQEYEEPKVDWNQIEVDTPILVRDSENEEWLKKYFAKYEDGLVYVWNLGRTSWTAPNKSVSAWRYAKLVEDEKEPEIDWSKVAVDTPILVRQGKNGTWLERHFAKYENGDVYAWVDGQTSWTGADKIKWKYAKLAENEESK